jgi:hypothetical protein
MTALLALFMVNELLLPGAEFWAMHAAIAVAGGLLSCHSVVASVKRCDQDDYTFELAIDSLLPGTACNR